MHPNAFFRTHALDHQIPVHLFLHSYTHSRPSNPRAPLSSLVYTPSTIKSPCTSFFIRIHALDHQIPVHLFLHSYTRPRPSNIRAPLSHVLDHQICGEPLRPVVYTHFTMRSPVLLFVGSYIRPRRKDTKVTSSFFRTHAPEH